MGEQGVDPHFCTFLETSNRAHNTTPLNPLPHLILTCATIESMQWYEYPSHQYRISSSQPHLLQHSSFVPISFPLHLHHYSLVTNLPFSSAPASAYHHVQTWMQNEQHNPHHTWFHHRNIKQMQILLSLSASPRRHNWYALPLTAGSSRSECILSWPNCNKKSMQYQPLDDNKKSLSPVWFKDSNRQQRLIILNSSLHYRSSITI